MSSQIAEILEELEALKKRVHTLEQLPPKKLDQNYQYLGSLIKKELARGGPGLKTVIIYSPGRDGKSFYRADLAKFFKCWPIVEDWSPDKKIVRGALHLCNTPMADPPTDVTQMTFIEACLISGIDPLRKAEPLKD